jgi:hypothetical protein
MKKKKILKMFNAISLVGVSISGAFIGFIMIILAEKVKGFEDIMNTIGQTIMTISISSILLEWFGYVNYTRNRISEILVEDEVLKILNMERKRELKKALIKNIYMPNASFDENNISTIIDEEMDNILKGYYYDEYITYIDAYKIQDSLGNTYLKKDVRITFTAKTVNKGKKTYVIDTLLRMCLDPIDTKEYELVELRKLLINEKNVTEHFKNNLVQDANLGDLKDSYPIYIKLNKENKNFKKYLCFNDKIYIDMEYSTIVNIDDLLYTHQIDKACKHYCVHFNVKPEEFDMTVVGFGFMSLGNNKRQRCIKTNNGYMLRFLDWILPGDGVNVVLKDKTEHKHQSAIE